MITSFFSASGLAAAGQCRVRLELSYLLVGTEIIFKKYTRKMEENDDFQ